MSLLLLNKIHASRGWTTSKVTKFSMCCVENIDNSINFIGCISLNKSCIAALLVFIQVWIEFVNLKLIKSCMFKTYIFWDRCLYPELFNFWSIYGNNFEFISWLVLQNQQTNFDSQTRQYHSKRSWLIMQLIQYLWIFQYSFLVPSKSDIVVRS